MSREYFHLKKKRHSFAFVKRMGGGSVSFLSARSRCFRDQSLPRFCPGRCRDQPAAGQPPLSSCPGFPARPCGGSLHGPRSLPPSAGVYVIRCESLQIPPLCVIWAGRSILPPPARRNNGEPPGLPRIIRNSNRDERDLLPSRRRMLQFLRKNKSMRLNGFSLAPRWGYTLFKFYPQFAVSGINSTAK